MRLIYFATDSGDKWDERKFITHKPTRVSRLFTLNGIDSTVIVTGLKARAEDLVSTHDDIISLRPALRHPMNPMHLWQK